MSNIHKSVLSHGSTGSITSHAILREIATELQSIDNHNIIYDACEYYIYATYQNIYGYSVRIHILNANKEGDFIVELVNHKLNRVMQIRTYNLYDQHFLNKVISTTKRMLKNVPRNNDG